MIAHGLPARGPQQFDGDAIGFLRAVRPVHDDALGAAILLQQLQKMGQLVEHALPRRTRPCSILDPRFLIRPRGQNAPVRCDYTVVARPDE